MRSIAKPTITVKDVFTLCISTVADAVYKQQLIDCTTRLEIGEQDFDSKFGTNSIYQIAQDAVVFGPIGKRDMTVVYDYRMVKPHMPGFKFYSLLKGSARNGRCPLCSVREVETLDHYLPKSKYPVYSVTPINLIPSCFRCNKGKHIDYPTTSQEQTLHPYFDNLENDTWVYGKVLQTNPIGFQFYAHPPNTWPQILKERAVNHFNAFQLNDLFSFHADDELTGAKAQLVNLFNDHPDLLREYLLESYNSRKTLGLNSWQAVFYNTLFNDSWFCNGGVLT